jgi:hypothetical protein
MRPYAIGPKWLAARIKIAINELRRGCTGLILRRHCVERLSVRGSDGADLVFFAT